MDVGWARDEGGAPIGGSLPFGGIEGREAKTVPPEQPGPEGAPQE